ncbi:MAG: hypothetical protein IJ087_10260 [Eggerthellaceae bacterium]|nr:hypothetical protein [Eggerthellaceae bacterium]
MTGKTITVKAKTLKNASKTIALKKAFKVANKASAGKLAFEKAKGASKIVVKSGGKVVLKRGLAKKAYTVKVRAAQAATKNYKAKTIKAVKLTVKVV